MNGWDPRRVEHQIRSLPGVVACQIGPTSALVLLGPDGDPAAVEEQVAALLAAASAPLAVQILAAPRQRPAAFGAARRRRRAAVAVAGSAAALSASMAAAATLVVLVDDDGSESASPTARQDDTRSPSAERRGTETARRPAATADGAPAPAPDRSEPAPDRSAGGEAATGPALPAAAAPVLVSVPLPTASVGLPRAENPPSTAPAPQLPPAVVAPDRRAVAAEPRIVRRARAVADETTERLRGLDRPLGVARRSRSEVRDGPSPHASPVAGAEGAREHRRRGR